MSIHLRVYLLDDRPSGNTLDFRGIDSSLLVSEWLELLECKMREQGREPSSKVKRVGNNDGSHAFSRRELPRDVTVLSADGSRRIELRKGGQTLSTCSLTMGTILGDALGGLRLDNDREKNTRIAFIEVWAAFDPSTATATATPSATYYHASNEERKKMFVSSSTNPQNTSFMHPKRIVRVGLEAPMAMLCSPDDAYITRPRLDYMNKEINLLRMHATKIDHSLAACMHGSDSKRNAYQLPHPNMPFVTKQIAAAVASPRTKRHYANSTEQLLSGKERTEAPPHRTKAPNKAATLHEEDVLVIVEDEGEEDPHHQSYGHGSKAATAAVYDENEPCEGATGGANGDPQECSVRDTIEGNKRLHQHKREEKRTKLFHTTDGTVANSGEGGRRVAEFNSSSVSASRTCTMLNNEGFEPTKASSSRQSSHHRSVVHNGEKKSSSRSVSETSEDCRLLLRREYSPPIGKCDFHNCPLAAPVNLHAPLASSFEEKTSFHPSAPWIGQVRQEAHRSGGNEISSTAASVSARIFLEMCRVRARCSVSAANDSLKDANEEQSKLWALVESFSEQSLSRGRNGYDGDRTSAGADVVVVHSEMIEVCLPNDGGEMYTVGELKNFLLKNVLPPTYASPNGNGRGGAQEQDLLRQRVIIKHGRRLLFDEDESVEGLLRLSTGRQESNSRASGGLVDDEPPRNVTVQLSCRYLL